MKTVRVTPHRQGHQAVAGFTLLEISLVISLILGLGMLTGFSINAVQDWNKAKSAAISLQAVHAAQRSYLADHPTTDIQSVTAADLLPYLPEGWATIPTATGLKGESLTVIHSVMPPYFTVGTTRYDPSKTQTDGLWDAGQ